MKPTPNDNSTLTQKGIQDSVSFAISESGLPHLLDILRNSMYSDKILAVVREYSCNAVDAHVQSDQDDRAIVVGLPTRLKPELSIRDFGKGLNHEQIRSIYTQYGESTKRGTNDAIGMFGIGCKSAFAYSDSFWVKSYLNGQCYHYNAIIDPSKVGKCDLLGVSDTDEENGIEVVVPVKNDDIDTFHNTAKDFYRHFKVKPQIIGYQNFFEEESDPLLVGSDWQWTPNRSQYYHEGRPLAIMGNVAYRIDKKNIKNLPENLEDMFNDSLILEFEIGELSVAASREMLEYTDVTIKNIVDKLRRVKAEIITEVKDKFSKTDTFWEAKKLYGNLFSYASNYYTLSRIIKKIDWSGEEIDDDGFGLWELRHTPIKAFKYEKSRNTGKWRRVECNRITAEDNAKIYYNDLPNTRGLYARCSQQCDAGEKVYVINAPETYIDNEGKTQKGMQKFLQTTKIDCEIHKLSEVTLPKDFGKRNVSGTRSHTPTNPKNNLKVFKFVSDGSAGDTDGVSDYWKPVDVDLNEQTDAIYVEIDRYKVDGKDPDSYFGSLSRMKELGIEMPEVIYGVKKNTVGKLGEGWIKFIDVAFKNIVEFAQSRDMHSQAVDHANREQLRNAYEWISSEESHTNEILPHLEDDHPFVELNRAAIKARRNREPYALYQSIKGNLKTFGVDYNDLEKALPDAHAQGEDVNPYIIKAEKLIEQYPMLRFATVSGRYYSESLDVRKLKVLVGYLKG